MQTGESVAFIVEIQEVIIVWRSARAFKCRDGLEDIFPEELFLMALD